MSSSGSVRLRYEKCLEVWGNATRYITPAIEKAGWDPMTQIFHEFGLRAGRISVRGKFAHRDKSTVLKADYALFFKPNIPIAVVEAKDMKHGLGSGMPQAIAYAQLLGVPFAFASNGDGFIFRDETLTDEVLEQKIELQIASASLQCDGH